MAFLERIKDELSNYGGGKAATAPANSLNRDFGYSTFVTAINQRTHALQNFYLLQHIMRCLLFHRRPKLKENMQYCVDHPEELSKIAKVKAQVSEVKGVMMENIEKVYVLCGYNKSSSQTL